MQLSTGTWIVVQLPQVFHGLGDTTTLQGLLKAGSCRSAGGRVPPRPACQQREAEEGCHARRLTC